MNVELRLAELGLGEMGFGHGKRITRGFRDLAGRAEATCREAQEGTLKAREAEKYFRGRC